MSLETEINLENHRDKCRCCLQEFEEDDSHIKITAIVQIRFQELTQIDLRNDDNYSSVICERCNNDLRSFSLLRKDMVFKQTSLYGFVDGIIEELRDPDDEETYLEDVSMSIKHELGEDTSGSVDVKMEAEVENVVYSGFAEEYLYNDEVIDEDHLYEADQFSASQLERVSDKASNPKKYYKRALCGLCGNSYYKDQLQRHIDKVHYKLKRYFCDLCEFGSFLKCNLSTHMAKHIAKEFREQIHCSFCTSTFTRIESLKNHMKTEHERNPEILKCFCGKEFNLRHKLTTHIKRTHNNRRDHPCKSCVKRFFTPKELKMHTLKNHTPGYVDKSDHYCDTCGKRYSSSKSLKTHMKHHKEPEYVCQYEGCRKGFISRLLLSNHEKIHLGQRDHMCHLCDKSFFSANHLRRHIAVTHDRVRVNCFVENCRFSVGRKDYLRNHIILSHRELPEDTKNVYLRQIREMKI